ncbi:MAG: UDP-N-acetylmuramate--L-alanine ligase [Spirochaetaceae bacterium]|jgi:UDP-N-acetylmuramate--alanine ligase|nr:UDP-N-acetylmuramate--L-alanine ligase [Spirochaetaceae bacterium]
MDFAMPGGGGVVYMVGIKGTGMCALAELLDDAGVWVTGSDRAETFYTSAILDALGIPYYESFARGHIPDNAALVVYSAAYDPAVHVELLEAAERGIPVLKYTEALGAFSARFDSSGIAGVHGKTTTTAMTGSLLRALGLPAKVLAGSAVGTFGDGSAGGARSTLSLGDKYFVAETCEYRRHFLSFHPRRIVLTGVESDHQDYYPTYESIRGAFLEYIALLPAGGELIYSADDPGAVETAALAARAASDAGKLLRLVPYGFSAAGDFRIAAFRAGHERLVFSLAGFPGEFSLRVPGRHSAQNAAAALALAGSLFRAEYGDGAFTGPALEKARAGLLDFTGSRRRAEILGEAGGVLFMDDYGHHPTAIRTTLAGLREFYPARRLVVSFMSHTYTRTRALMDDFAASFEDAGAVFLHKIYGSAREDAAAFAIDGRTLYEKTRLLRGAVFYVDEPLDAAGEVEAMLRPGDIFLTLGAGDNWKLGRLLFEKFRAEEEKRR